MNDPSRTTSTSSYTDFSASKGLDNHKGQNNCWLNATIQLLWHQDGFRESLYRLRKFGHYRCRQKQCVYCQIQNLLQKYIYEKNQSIPPDELREALTLVNQSFVAGEMGDPIEAYETVLKVLCVHLTDTDDSEQLTNCDQPHCLVHQKFHHHIVEERECGKCFNTKYHRESELSKWVSARDVIDLPGYTSFTKLFSQKGPDIDCDEYRCDGKCKLRKRLENDAETFVISIGWDSQRTPLDDIKVFINKLQCRIKLSELYDEVSGDCELLLNGIVCYYGMHYTAYIYHTNMKRWVFLDDNNVKDISSSWITVMNHMTRNYQQPCMLLYSKLDKFKKLDLTYAPKKVVFDKNFQIQDVSRAAPVDNFTNMARKEKENQELKDEEFARRMQEELIAEEKKQLRVEEEKRRQYEIQKRNEEQKILEDSLRRQREEEIFAQQKKAEADASAAARKQYEWEMQRRIYEDIQRRNEAEELAKKKREEEAAKIKLKEERDALRRQKENELKRLQDEVRQKQVKEAEERRRRALQEERERSNLQEQNNVGIYPSISNSLDHSFDPSKYYNDFTRKARKKQEENFNNASNLDQRSPMSSQRLSETLPKKFPSYESDPVRPNSRHRGQSPPHSSSSESQHSFVVHETHQKRSNTNEQNRSKKNVVENPSKPTEDKSAEPNLMSFDFDHLHRVNGSQSLESQSQSQSTGLMSSFKNNVKSRSKKLLESAKLISNSRSKHLETFPDYVPENPNAVTRSRPTGSMQRSEFKNILHLSEGKSSTSGAHGHNNLNSTRSSENRPRWKY